MPLSHPVPFYLVGVVSGKLSIFFCELLKSFFSLTIEIETPKQLRIKRNPDCETSANLINILQEAFFSLKILIFLVRYKDGRGHAI